MHNPSISAPNLLKVVEGFGKLSGFKINWPKSACLPLNDTARSTDLPADIPIVKHFKCLGIEIFPTLNQTVKHNYTGTYDKVLQDLNRWSSLPNSLQARASIIKIDVLPRIHCQFNAPSTPPLIIGVNCNLQSQNVYGTINDPDLKDPLRNAGGVTGGWQSRILNYIFGPSR